MPVRVRVLELFDLTRGNEPDELMILGTTLLQDADQTRAQIPVCGDEFRSGLQPRVHKDRHLCGLLLIGGVESHFPRRLLGVVAAEKIRQGRESATRRERHR